MKIIIIMRCQYLFSLILRCPEFLQVFLTNNVLMQDAILFHLIYIT